MLKSKRNRGHLTSTPGMEEVDAPTNRKSCLDILCDSDDMEEIFLEFKTLKQLSVGIQQCYGHVQKCPDPDGRSVRQSVSVQTVAKDADFSTALSCLER